MSTEFIAFLPPPGDSILRYNRKAPPNEQAEDIPPHFVDAMTVREQVFVQEQGVALEVELDVDDARSFHWIVYASVSSSSNDPDTGRKGSQGSSTPVGTLRLVPPPHKTHDESEHGQGVTHGTMKKTAMYNGHEPYAKLGRLAALKAYRGLGLGKLLVNAALDWAKGHAEEVLPLLSPARREAVGQQDEDTWKGLIFIHAQTKVQQVWERLGFVRDVEMGNWNEEGMDHVGMWKRVDVTGV
jgi:predicted GNAT family N-acyltransferase